MPIYDKLAESITLRYRPMDREGWMAEVVTLAVTATGEVILRQEVGGKVIQMYSIDFNANEQTIYRVAAVDVPRLLEAVTADLFPDTDALVSWAASRQLPTEPGQWHGLAVRPVNQDKLLLEALSTILGPVDESEIDMGQRIVSRFHDWLKAKGVGYGRTSEAFPYE
jgi:hypothetical protein